MKLIFVENVGKMSEYCIFTFCTRMKYDYTNCKAIQLYRSGFFPIIRKYNHNNIDVYIISAKYGLLNENDKVSNYDLFLDDKRYEEIKKEVIMKIKEVLKNKYKDVMLALGGNYLKFFDEINDKRLIKIPFLRGRKIVKDFIIDTDKTRFKIGDFT